MDLQIWILSSVITVCFGTKNQIPDVPSDETECSGRMNYLSDVNLNTKIILPPPLTGKWVSERCEIRTGPQYLLRSYTFLPNNTFYLLQFFYTDDSCSSITHAVSAKGVYKYKDSLPAKLHYKVNRITFTFHDLQYINDLPSLIGDDCAETIGKTWKPFREYVIYDHNRKPKDTEDDGNAEPYRSKRAYAKNTEHWDADMRCLSSMNVSFDELYTLRVQRRPANDNKSTRYELLLGASHPYHEKKRKASLLKFQLPLILLNETTNDCPVCTIVSTCSHMFVPHLTAKATLPLFFNGEWLSETCEARTMGLHTIRTYRFNHYLTEWEMETKYYSNYACSNLLMVYTTVGHYHQGSISNSVSGATEIDFQIEKSYLTIADQTILETIENDLLCGIPYYWKMNVKKEIPSKRGCSSLALVNPIVRYDIIKLDVDYDGSYILLLGDDGSADTEQNELERPTAYDYPLVQCSAEPQLFADLASEPTPSKASWIRHDFYILSIFILVNI